MRYYKLVITELVENENYEEEMANFEGSRVYGSSIRDVPLPRREFETKQLETVVSKEGMRQIQELAFSIFGRGETEDEVLGDKVQVQFPKQE